MQLCCSNHTAPLITIATNMFSLISYFSLYHSLWRPLFCRRQQLIVSGLIFLPTLYIVGGHTRDKQSSWDAFTKIIFSAENQIWVSSEHKTKDRVSFRICSNALYEFQQYWKIFLEKNPCILFCLLSTLIYSRSKYTLQYDFRYPWKQVIFGFHTRSSVPRWRSSL